MDNRPIGVFDSGIGGLTVLKQLRKRLPKEEYIYLGDTNNFPYGEKSTKQIIEFTRNNINILINNNVKLIVIACGTATSQALEIVKKEFEIPIIGIIEPTVDYIKAMNLSKVGVIATTGTIKNGAWERKIKKKIKDIKVINRACPLLAGIAEEGKAKSKKSLDAVHEYMQIFKDNNVKTIILGCTHYPIYNEIIKKEFEYEVNLVNTGVAVANKVQDYLIKNDIQNNKNTKIEPNIILTKK